MLSSRSDILVRDAKPADAPALAAVFVASWTNAYRGIIPHSNLEGIVRRRDVAWWRTQIRSGDTILVVETSGVIAGYASCGAARARGSQQGEIYELYLAPNYQGLGFGEHLFEACRYRLDDRRLKGLIVWALADNEGAISFYERRGGRKVARISERFGRTKLEKVALGWG